VGASRLSIVHRKREYPAQPARIRCVTRGWPVFFALALLLRADALDDAARSLAKRISTHLSAGDTVRLIERNMSSLPAAEALRARQVVERSLRRPARNGTPVEVLLTLSENPEEALLVAEISKGEERWVELTTFRPTSVAASRDLPTLTKRLIWEQRQPILDVSEHEGFLFVLDSKELAAYERQQRIGSWAMPPVPRDPVARLSFDGDRIIVKTPDRECSGAWRPQLSIECAVPGESGNTWRSSSMPAHYSIATASGGMTVLTEPDGLAHLYSNGARPLGSWKGWGSEIVAVCGGKLLVSSDRPRDRGDVLRVFDIVEGKPVPAADPMELQGPVMAMSAWPEGALVVVHDLMTSNYAAYHVTVDCTR
jgi:hypothetical protein